MISSVSVEKFQSTSQSQNCTEKRLDHSLVVCYLSDPLWIPVKTLPLRSMLSKSMRRKENCNICSQHWLAERAQFFFMTTTAWPHMIQPTVQKLNKFGYGVSPHLPYSPDLSPTNYHFFKHLDNFLQGKCFHRQQEAKNAFQEFIESWSIDFYTTEINKFISHWQTCVDCNCSYFDYSICV